MTDPRLTQAVQELDPGTRALLDLSLRRAIPDERVAGLLGVDLAEIPRRRARGIAQLADKLAVPGPAELAALLVAIPDLPEEAWGVPTPKLPKVSAARRAKAFRRAAVAASPLVAAAAVLAAVIVSGGGGGQKSANLTLSNGAAAGGKHAPAAVAKAPAKSAARPALPHGAEVASAEGPSLATTTKARKAAAARHRRQRQRARRHRQQHHVVNTVPVSDNFASSAPRPDAYVPPPKPKHKEHKQHPRKHKDTQPETPPATTTPEVETPTTTTPQVVASPPTQQVTTTTPDVMPPKQEGYKKPPVPALPVQSPPSGDDDQGDDNSGGGGCGHGGGNKPQGDVGHKWQGGDQKSSVFKTRRELSRQRYGLSQD